MIIVLSSSSFRLRTERRAQLVEAFVKKAGSGSAVEHVFVTPELTAKQLWTKLGTGSLFANKRLMIVHDAFALRAAEAKALVVLLKKRALPTGTTLVLLAAEPFPAQIKQPLVGFCKKNAGGQGQPEVKLMSVAVPQGAALVRELIARAQREGVRIATTEARMLVERITDFDQLLAELDKLSMYALSKPKPVIQRADIEAMTSSSLEADIFALLGALSRGDRATALGLLHQQFAAGSHPLYLLAMLRYQFRSLLLVAEASRDGASPPQIQKRTGLSPYVIRTMTQSLDRYSPQSIRALFNKLVDADEAIKTSAIDGDVALDVLVLAMSA